MESGIFVGRFGDQEYELGSTEAGLARATYARASLRGASPAVTTRMASPYTVRTSFSVSAGVKVQQFRRF